VRRLGAIGLVAALLVLAFVPPGEAHGRRSGVRTRVFVGVGPTFWWGPPVWYYPQPVYVYPRPYVVEQPTVYVQQAPATGPLEPGYWYYCQSAGAYYPTAPTCPEAWVKVPPRTE
jgi:hypothetical protein